MLICYQIFNNWTYIRVLKVVISSYDHKLYKTSRKIPKSLQNAGERSTNISGDKQITKLSINPQTYFGHQIPFTSATPPSAVRGKTWENRRIFLNVYPDTMDHILNIRRWIRAALSPQWVDGYTAKIRPTLNIAGRDELFGIF